MNSKFRWLQVSAAAGQKRRTSLRRSVLQEYSCGCGGSQPSEFGVLLGGRVAPSVTLSKRAPLGVCTDILG